ncbi:MAG TPA: TetR/AcrR family transcriptional regulator [Nocardia sp.]|uniref:TetR/AcrR family transcriptional regulator n=1 Tax=Nocardia TaxID=1817 RepID=UPI002456E13D|nr:MULTISPECIES: TetR/AcrR family transcriptional regulator [Nocardia]HLS78223.1 TetR/AcrR family transcriptional regulator [Nocardia sp.]
MSEKMSMPESGGTRERLVTAMAEQLRVRGYHGTPVKQVTVAANAPMGSLYHHFPEGKPQLAAAALRTSGAAYLRLIPLLLDEHDDLGTGIPAVFAAAAEQMEQAGWINMCPVVTVAGEIADSEPELREVSAEIVTSWIEEGIACFRRRGVAAAEARELILAVLTALEGAFVLSRTLRSGEPLRAAGRALGPRFARLPVREARAR